MSHLFFFFPGILKYVADFQYIGIRADKCNGAQVDLTTTWLICYTWNTQQRNVSMEMDDPVEQVAGVLYRLDKHDYSQ